MTLFLALISTASADLPASIDAMTLDANEAYDGSVTNPVSSSGPTRLQPARLTMQLGQAMNALNNAGCMVSGDAFLSGAYSNGADGLDGITDTDETFLGTADRESRTLAGSFGGGDTAGDTVGSFAKGRFVLDRSDGSFYVGQFARVAGPNGIFMALQGSCPSGTEPESTLSGWFKGDMVGLNPPAESTTCDEEGGELVDGECWKATPGDQPAGIACGYPEGYAGDYYSINGRINDSSLPADPAKAEAIVEALFPGTSLDVSSAADCATNYQVGGSVNGSSMTCWTNQQRWDRIIGSNFQQLVRCTNFE